MEKWRVMTAAAAVSVAVVGGLAVSTSVVAASRTDVSTSAMVTQANSYTNSMTAFCTTNPAVTRNSGTYNATAIQCAKPR